MFFCANAFLYYSAELFLYTLHYSYTKIVDAIVILNNDESSFANTISSHIMYMCYY